MRKQAGFTLIELMVSLTIIGILAATSVPAYKTYRQRAYGQEASLMVKQILDGQVLYYLEHDEFYPVGGGTIFIDKDDDPEASEVQDILDGIIDAIKLEIPVGPHLSYQLVNYGDSFTVSVYADWAIFKDYKNGLQGTIYRDGRTFILPISR